LPFVSKFLNSNDVKEIVNDIRKTLELKENWAKSFQTWQEAQDHLVLHIEDKELSQFLMEWWKTMDTGNSCRRMPWVCFS